MMVEWLNSWAIRYDLSVFHALVSVTSAFVCLWVMQCLTARTPTWVGPWAERRRHLIVLTHRLLLAALAGALFFSAATPLVEKQAYPWTSDVLVNCILLGLLLIWPLSSKTRHLSPPGDRISHPAER